MHEDTNRLKMVDEIQHNFAEVSRIGISRRIYIKWY